MKKGIILVIMFSILLMSSLAYAQETLDIPIEDIEYADDVYYAQITRMTPIEKFLYHIGFEFAITPSFDTDDIKPNQKVKFAGDSQIDPGDHCGYGNLIMEVYREGKLYKTIKDDGWSDLPPPYSPSAWFEFTLPSDSAGEYWNLIEYFRCGNEKISDESEFSFKVVGGDYFCQYEIIELTCFDDKVIEHYIDTDCKQKQKVIEECGGHTESCQNGKCVKNTVSCFEYNGDICEPDEVCYGVDLDTLEDNCCSITCATPVECLSDLGCDLDEFCDTDNTCKSDSEKEDEELDDDDIVDTDEDSDKFSKSLTLKQIEIATGDELLGAVCGNGFAGCDSNGDCVSLDGLEKLDKNIDKDEIFKKLDKAEDDKWWEKLPINDLFDLFDKFDKKKIGLCVISEDVDEAQKTTAEKIVDLVDKLIDSLSGGGGDTILVFGLIFCGFFVFIALINAFGGRR